MKNVIFCIGAPDACPPMDSPFVTAYLISVGFLLMGAGYSVLLARHSVQPLAQWSYGALCLCFALFQMACALQYSANDAAAAVQAHRWLNLWSLAVVPVCTFFFESLASRRPRLRLTAAVGAITLLIVVHNFTTPFGYRFTELLAVRQVQLPWGETLRLLSGTPDALFQGLRLATLVLLAFSLPRLSRMLRLSHLANGRGHDQARAWRSLPWLALGLMAGSSSLAVLTDVGVLSVPYVAGFGFMLMSVVFLWVVVQDLGRLQLRRSKPSGAHSPSPTPAAASALSAAPAPAPRRQVQQLQQAQQPQPAVPTAHAIATEPWGAPATGDHRFSGLPDRTGLLWQLAPMLDAHRLQAVSLAVFVFDVDRFDLLCATHGHAAGDALLAEVAERLQNALRPGDLLARGHGASFSVVCTGVAAHLVAQRHAALDQAFNGPIPVNGKVLNVRASAGVARFPGDGLTAEAVLGAAELALHEAKTAGRSGSALKTFTPALKDQLQEQLELEDDLRIALDEQQFVLHYQPQVHGDSGQVVGMEALVRWQHPARGLLSPARFIALAESSGLIHRLGAWVLDTACRQLAQWHAHGHPGLRMAVNLSAHQLEDESLEALITQTLERYQLPPALLELEITESVLMPQLERATERLAALAALGVRLSIDDFGTGYSSLSYLRRLPVHAFKLDQSFIRDVDLSGRGQAVCATAIGLAFDLKLEIVAEGVETVQQAHLLKHWGCHLLQGYLFSRPLPAAAATAFLESAAPAHDATDEPHDHDAADEPGASMPAARTVLPGVALSSQASVSAQLAGA
ncbi:MAG: bifunctional diguanylate cyclase/phosphodiesterase [Comamonadaceae bacterium]|nr:MAG: bifunctional diguanylate cyclase/phosphodiesterase [Comamonadaceae bacterium]